MKIKGRLTPKFYKKRHKVVGTYKWMTFFM